jgi:hypothetical protein
MTTEHTCEKVIWSGFYKSKCSKKAKHEHEGHWYCKTHHPPTVRAKTDARNEKWKKEWAAKRERDALEAAQKAEQQRRATLYPDLIQAMREIARLLEGGEKSAQGIAREMLKKCGEDAP